MLSRILISLLLLGSISICAEDTDVSPLTDEAYREKVKELSKLRRAESLRRLSSRSSAREEIGVIELDTLVVRPFKSTLEEFMDEWRDNPEQFAGDDGWGRALRARPAVDKFFNPDWFSIGYTAEEMVQMFARDEYVAQRKELFEALERSRLESDPNAKRDQQARFEYFLIKREAINIESDFLTDY